MKKYIRISLSLVLFVSTVLWQVSCKRVGELEIVNETSNDSVYFYNGAIPIDQKEYEKIPLIEDPFLSVRKQDISQILVSHDVPDMPPVDNQKQQGSCTSWSVAYAARSALYKKYNPRVLYYTSGGSRNDQSVFSPAFIHNTLSGTKEGGVAISKALDFVQAVGVCKMSDMPYKDTDLTAPNAAQVAFAGGFKIKEWGRISIEVNTFRNFLYVNNPIVIGINTDENFRTGTDATSSNERIWKKYDQATNNGIHKYHAVVIVGFNDDLRAFKIQNSWGDSWQNKGYIWLSYDLMATVTKEAYVMLGGGETRVTPIIETMGHGDAIDGKVKLNGNIKTLGDGITEYGFLVGKDNTNLILGSGSVETRLHSQTKITGVPYPYTLDLDYKTLSSGSNYYFRAYAISVSPVPGNNNYYYGAVLPLKPKVSDETVPDITEPLPTSISTGDPHITTLDRARYSFMAVGEFVALKSTTDKFEVQARQQEVTSKSNSGQVSFNTGVAVNTGNDVVCIYPPNRITVNKQAISYNFENYALSNGGSIRKDGSQLYIRNANGDQIEVRLFAQDLDYYITLNSNRKSKVKGIIGNYDGNAANDLVTSTGQSVANNYQSLYPVFSDSWRIKQAESLFTYDSGKSTESYTDRNFPRTQVNLTSSQEAAARSICAQQGVTDPVTLQNCIMDVALTGDNSYAQRAETSESNGALRNFSIGNFNNFRNDVGLYEATMSAEGVKFNDLNCSGSCSLPAIYWKEKLDFSKGFETEITFTASKVVATSNDNSLGVCGIEAASSSSPSVYSTLLSGAFDSNAQKKTSTRVAVASGQVANNGSLIANVFDGQRHRLRVIVSRSSASNGFSGNYKIYLDGASTPAVSGNFTQSQYFRNMLFPSLYGENVLVHSWTMKSLM